MSPVLVIFGESRGSFKFLLLCGAPLRAPEYLARHSPAFLTSLLRSFLRGNKYALMLSEVDGPSEDRSLWPPRFDESILLLTS